MILCIYTASLPQPFLSFSPTRPSQASFFPLQPDSSWLVVLVAHFSCQSFPCRKHQAGIVSHEQTGLSALACKHFNFTGLIKPWPGSGRDGGLCFRFCWTLTVCWLSSQSLNVQFSPTFESCLAFWHVGASGSSVGASAAICRNSVLISRLGLLAEVEQTSDYFIKVDMCWGRAFLFALVEQKKLFRF